MSEKEVHKDVARPLISEEKSPFNLTDEMLNKDFEEVYRNYPFNDDTSCGIGFLRNSFLQK
jgi:hypothetical protein